MKTAICYDSRHHGNTRRVLEALAKEEKIDLISVTLRSAVHLEEYDRVGFASGIYYGGFAPSVLEFARQYLPPEKDVFFLYTCGAKRRGYTRAITQLAQEKQARILGEFGCLGYDTFGPFRLIGGIAKGHPNEKDLKAAREFYRSLGE